MPTSLSNEHGRPSGLVEVLDRVLDKGLVVAGDIKISLAEVELLTIRIRLIVCSIDKAEQIGLDWWRYDSHLAPGRDRLAAENQSLKRQIRSLEKRVGARARPCSPRTPHCAPGSPPPAGTAPSAAVARRASRHPRRCPLCAPRCRGPEPGGRTVAPRCAWSCWRRCSPPATPRAVRSERSAGYSGGRVPAGAYAWRPTPMGDRGWCQWRAWACRSSASNDSMSTSRLAGTHSPGRCWPPAPP